MMSSLVVRRERRGTGSCVALRPAYEAGINSSASSVPQNSAVTTILVVDDEPIVREVVAYLEREGYRTLEAGDGDDAQLVERSRPTSSCWT